MKTRRCRRCKGWLEHDEPLRTCEPCRIREKELRQAEHPGQRAVHRERQRRAMKRLHDARRAVWLCIGCGLEETAGRGYGERCRKRRSLTAKRRRQ